MRRALAGLAVGTALALGACGGSGSGSGSGAQGSSASGQSTKPPPTRVEVIESQGKGTAFDAGKLYRAESPGVVTVISLFGSGSSLEQLLGGGGNGGGGGGDAAVGSGIVLDGKGEIATNAHVVTQGEGASIRRANQVFVEFADGNRVAARILGDDPDADVALLRVDPKGLDLHALPFGRSDRVTVGEPVAAIGSPFGEKQSLSVGVISAVDRSIQSLTNFNISGALQTDAAINPGNSGGPLVNARGQVIGINQQIKTNSGGGEGVGFAVPSNAVQHSLDMLRADGRARYAYLGVATVEDYPQLAQHFHLGTAHGAWVQDVVPGGPGDNGGLRGGSGQVQFQASAFKPGGDLITKVGGKPILHADDLSTVISGYEPGQSVQVQILRDGQPKTVTVTLGQRPEGGAAG